MCVILLYMIHLYVLYFEKLFIFNFDVKYSHGKLNGFHDYVVKYKFMIIFFYEHL